MKLAKWIETQPRGTLHRISMEARVAYSTIHRFKNGGRVGRYDTAKRISDATGGAVTVADLCDPNGDAK